MGDTTTFQQDNITIVQEAQRLFASFLSLLVIYSYLRFPLLRCNGFRLVCFLAVSDFCLNMQFFVFGFLQPYGNGDVVCDLQAFIKTFFINAGIFWTLLISLSLYSIIADMDAKNQLLRTFINNHTMHHACVWSYSAMCATVPLFYSGAYGYSGGGGCGFVFSSNKSKYFSIAFQWFNIWSVILITCIICFILRGKLQAVIAVDDQVRRSTMSSNNGSGQERSQLVQRIIELNNQLKWYPIILIVGWSITTGIRSYQMITDTDFDSMPEWVENMFTLTTGPTLQAVLNAIAYGFTPLVRKLWYEMICDVYRSKSVLVLLTCCPSSEEGAFSPISDDYGKDSLKVSISREASNCVCSDSDLTRQEVEMNENRGKRTLPLNPAKASSFGTVV
jgi:hypothetical protein